MLTPAEASKAIQAAMPSFSAAQVPLAGANGRILRQAVCAERDQPPFDRVTMDGIAISYAAIAQGTREFGIQARQDAGDSRLSLDDQDACIEIMTGAVLPANADCVIPVERVDVANARATLETAYQPEQFQFIHRQGTDYQQGNEILKPGHRIAAMDVAIIASCGLAEVEVAELPTVRVISTGNELVPAGQPIDDHQVRMSNGPAVISMLATHGYSDALHDHLPDDKDLLGEKLALHLSEANVLILSGGVSMGKADFVPDVLTELGVKLVFHKITQRPGLPMWFGIGPDEQAVFALPGNPVSTLVCCRHYVIPALAGASGVINLAAEFAVLAESYRFAPALTCFLAVRLTSGEDGQLLATPVVTNTSGDFAALSGTNGYVELDKDTSEFSAGSRWPLHRW